MVWARAASPKYSTSIAVVRCTSSSFCFRVIAASGNLKLAKGMVFSSEVHSTGHFDSLCVDPAVLAAQQRRDHRADVFGQPDAAERRIAGDQLVHFRVV